MLHPDETILAAWSLAPLLALAIAHAIACRRSTLRRRQLLRSIGIPDPAR